MIELAERRMLSADVELREDSEGSGDFTFSGMVTTYGEPYKVSDYRETIAPDAFKDYLENRDNNVMLLVSHGGLPLASRQGKTMEATSTKDGVEIKASLSKDDPEARSIASKVKRGDVTGMSVGMIIRDEDWNDDGSERTITRADLFEASITAMPANPATSAEVREKRGVVLEERCEVRSDENDRIEKLEARVDELEGTLTQLRHEKVVLDNARRRQVIDELSASYAVLEAVREN